MASYGYYTFNYRSYGSLIRGGHNFNVLAISDKKIGSHKTKMDFLIAMDELTEKTHKQYLKKDAVKISHNDFKEKKLGRDLNVALSAALLKCLGIPKKVLLKKIKEEFNTESSEQAVDIGYNLRKTERYQEEITNCHGKFKARKGGSSKKSNKWASVISENNSLKKLKNKIKIINGSQAIAQGAINSKLQRYFAYPMTPATGVLHELAEHSTIQKIREQVGNTKQATKSPNRVGERSGAERVLGGTANLQKKNLNSENNLIVFQPENEISAISMSLGSSFTGKLTMTGTSGGGFDLMSESLSMQGISEIPLTVYLASRPGPGTGVPTYSSQSDLDIALRAGHGEFPRIVITPGTAKETIEQTNEALFLSEKFKTLSVILSDKHLAESEFSFSTKIKKPKQIKISRDIPGKNKIVKASSYETNKLGNSTEDPKIVKTNQEARLKKYAHIKKFCEKNCEMIKTYGDKNAKNLIIGWGSTKPAILDTIDEIKEEEKKKRKSGLDYPSSSENSNIKGGVLRKRSGSNEAGISNPKHGGIKFLQILYMKPLSNKIKKEMQKAENIILVENNLTGQLGRLLREKTGIGIPEKNRILKYDSRPFHTDELKKEIGRRLR